MYILCNKLFNLKEYTRYYTRELIVITTGKRTMIMIMMLILIVANILKHIIIIGLAIIPWGNLRYFGERVESDSL